MLEIEDEGDVTPEGVPLDVMEDGEGLRPSNRLSKSL